MSLALHAQACASQFTHLLYRLHPGAPALASAAVRLLTRPAARPALLVLAVLAAVLALPGDLLAQSASDPFGGLTNKGNYVVDSGFNWAKILALLGALVIAVLGFFKKWPWGWVASFAGGLVLLAIAPDIINWGAGNAGFSSKLTTLKPSSGGTTP